MFVVSAKSEQEHWGSNLIKDWGRHIAWSQLCQWIVILWTKWTLQSDTWAAEPTSQTRFQLLLRKPTCLLWFYLAFEILRFFENKIRKQTVFFHSAGMITTRKQVIKLKCLQSTYCLFFEWSILLQHFFVLVLSVPGIPLGDKQAHFVDLTHH